MPKTMLVQVTIENFRSFREPITFSMLGVNSDQTHVNHLTVDAVGDGKSILPVAAIYGANAAGKSNLIEAIDFAKDLICEGTRSGKIIPVSPFKLGDSSEKNSKFEFIFTYQNTSYSYGFTLKPSQILEEWLYVIDPKQKEEVLYFERMTSETGETKVKYGEPLKGTNDENQQFLDFIAKGTRSNQLFLTEAVDRNVDRLVPIVNWFKRVLTIIPAESRFLGLEIGILSSEEDSLWLVLDSAYRYPIASPTELETEFKRLAKEWRLDTGMLSLVTQKSMHPAYQRIIGMGQPVVPLILHDLEQKPDHWFWALRAITGDNPVKPEQRGRMKQMAQAWIQWGKEHGYEW